MTTVVPVVSSPTLTRDEAPDRYAVDVVWTRANLAEVIPDQATPQVLDAFDYLLNNGQRLFVGGLMAPEEELGPPFKAFGGRLYFNLTQLLRVGQLGGAPPAAIMRSLGHAEALTPEDEIYHRPPIGVLLRALPAEDFELGADRQHGREPDGRPERVARHRQCIVLCGSW